jgi:ketosteroid isomerase-like protein
MQSKLMTLCLVLAASQPLQAADAGAELTDLLGQFLAGASVNDPAAHQRFWAEDLVYTSSSGKRFGKAEILESIAAEPSPPAGEPETVYSAEDLQLLIYGDAAVVAFRLVATPREVPGTVSQYLNTGTFLLRSGEWRAVAWQATRIPEPE